MLNIRPATRDDAYLVTTLIHESAEYDKIEAAQISSMNGGRCV